jgi:hypothetical protein
MSRASLWVHPGWVNHRLSGRMSNRTAIVGRALTRMLFRLAMAATIGSLLFSTPTDAQLLPPIKKSAQVEIIEEPALELVHDDLAIIRWTMSNPGGTVDHFGVVYYGRDPGDRGQSLTSGSTAPIQKRFSVCA